MAMENFADSISEVINKIMQGDLSGFEPILYLAISIAIYSIFIFHFYRFIARRDCFKIATCRYPKVIGFLKYFFFFPFVAFLFFLGLALIINFLTTDYSTPELLATSFALVLAIRLTAYYNEDLSRDVAKMLPFALLGIFLVSPDYFDFGSQTIQDTISQIPSILRDGLQYIFFIILIEWVLRILLTIRYAIISEKKKVAIENQE